MFSKQFLAQFHQLTIFQFEFHSIFAFLYCLMPLILKIRFYYE